VASDERLKTLTLPAYVDQELGAVPQSFAQLSTSETAAPPGTILLVDDSPIVIDAVSSFLEDAAWTVICAPSGANALEIARQQPLDLVICDLNMPDINGLDVFHAIYAIDPTLPVVILSEDRTVSNVLDSVHAGVFDFVPKTGYEDLLPTTIHRAITHCRLLRENQRLAQDLRQTNEGLEQRVQDQSVQIESRLRREATLEREAELAPLRRELEIARRIQTSILPLQPQIPGLEIATQMITASEVGGDYYDIRPTRDGGWIGIGDVAGHGLEAGLVMLMIQSGLATAILQNPDANPHEILSPLNQMLYDNLRRRMGRDDHATLTMLRFFKDGRLLYAGAHEDILICDARGKVRSITTHGTWVGIQEEIHHELESRCIQLQENDLVVLYTDGIPESRSGHECYGMQRLIREIESHHTQAARDVISHLIEEVRTFRGGGPPQDDASLIAFRYLGAC